MRPVVAVPPEIDTLLQRRAALWRDPYAMQELFTRDAVSLDARFGGWATGAARSAHAVGWLVVPPYKAYVLRPAFYRLDGEMARIKGYYVDAVLKQEPVGFFDMDLERDDDGRWRIASEVGSFPSRRTAGVLTADSLVKLLDDAGIRTAVVLSMAYSFDGLVPGQGDDYANVRAENDWTAEQVERHPDRLVALCSFNPVREHAITEMERCAKNPAFTGVKLHLGTSPVDLDNPAHVAKTRTLFEAANRLRLPVLVHLAASPEWGARQAEIFLTRLVAAAPDVQVVIAHLWGGAWYNRAALRYFADAVANRHPATKNLYFEVAQAAAIARDSAGALQEVADQMRRIGLNRLYYGSDGAQPPGGVPPKYVWMEFRKHVPLTDDEFRVLFGNVAPWARPRG